MICGLRWVAPNQQGQYHSKLLNGLLQAEERDREPQLIRQEELIFNKQREMEPRPQAVLWSALFTLSREYSKARQLL